VDQPTADLAFFDVNKTGELAGRLSTDVHEVAEHLVEVRACAVCVCVLREGCGGVAFDCIEDCSVGSLVRRGGSGVFGGIINRVEPTVHPGTVPSDLSISLPPPTPKNLSKFLFSAIMAAGSAGMLLHISPSLSAITLSVVPAMILGAAGYSRVVKRLSRELLNALASSTQVGEGVCRRV
jgi:ABC-type multidrug transport system fused ATPase/permease subunit